MERLHDLMTAGWVLGAAAAAWALAFAAVMARRPGGGRIAAGLAVGLVITGFSALAASSDRSGTWVRTRRGLPHFFMVENVDPETGEAAHPARVVPAYVVCDAALWCAVGLLAAALTAEARSGRRS
jgi:hypothetical protein